MARILIVDDEAEALDALERYFLKKGHNVRTALDGGAALEQFSVWEPDIILLDFLMPGLNGASFLRAFKDFPCNASIIVISGRLDTDLARYLLKLGAREFIKKPVDIKYLDLVISLELKLRRLSKPLSSTQQAPTISACSS